MSMGAAEFKQIITVASDAIITIDDHHRIIMFNEGAEAIFGYSRSEVMGESIGLLMPTRFRDRHDGHIDRFAVEPSPTRKMAERSSIKGRRKNGDEFPAVASLVRSHGSQGMRFTVILRDITVLHDMKLHLEQQIKRLEMTNMELKAKQAQRDAAEDLLDKLMRESHS